jgi:hypothetical protein
VLLTDGKTLYFLAGTHNPSSDAEDADSDCWLNNAEVDLQRWLEIFQQTLAVNTRPISAENKALKTFITPLRAEDYETSQRSNGIQAPRLASYDGTPIITTQGLAIGVVFVVSESAQLASSMTRQEALVTMAEKCMRQIEMKRQSVAQVRWKRMNEQLDRFLASSTIRDQQLEEPPSIRRADGQRGRKDPAEKLQNMANEHGRELPGETHASLEPEPVFDAGEEASRLLDAETETQHRIADQEEENPPRGIAADAGEDSKPSESQDETIYRKIFRRAAQCLQEALQVDGVLFIDGLVGHHGAVQPVPQAEDDLEREMAQVSYRFIWGSVGSWILIQLCLEP